MIKLFRSQVGDTIVEVLLSVVIVGLAITLGYGLASRSLRANRQAQERSEALKAAESQLERLKKRAATDTNGSGVFQPGAFCIADTGAGTNQIVDIIPAPNTTLASDPIVTGYPADCVDGLYHVSIVPNNLTTGTKQFTVQARWFGIGNIQKEETVITYRIYPGS